MILPTVAATLALFNLVRAGVSSSGVMGTIYYDGSGSCGKEGDVDGGSGNYSPEIEAHVGACGYSVDQIGDNRLVAFDASLMSGSPAEYCGKEIQVTKADGTPFEFSEGKLFIGDACPGCAGGMRLDLSAKALVEIVGDCKSNAMGISYQVLDTMAGPEYSSISGGSLGDGTNGNTSTSATSAAGVPDAAVSSASSSVPGVSATSVAGVPATAAADTLSSVAGVPTTSVAGVGTSVPGVVSSVPAEPSVPDNPATQTVANAATATVPAGVSSSSSVAAGVTSDTAVLGVPPSPSVPIGVSSSPTLAAGVTPTGVPGVALFAEGDVASNASCKRRKRRLGDRH
ncbi:uncharacterized protein L199_005656 [Kwoniella botswanensis]|uniref:uncharacterized protein n=1 Tax=Kwoniella botswanensis TaxID=1268659 RepID=UPI00315D2583